MSSPEFIQATDLERETGFSKDLLRKWRSRYGFPNPLKYENGVIGYSREQIDLLRVIKRLLDSGFRPAQVVGKRLYELERLADAVSCAKVDEGWTPFTLRAIDLLRNHDVEGLERHFEQDLAQRGLTGFVQETIAPLTVALGEAWARGDIKIHQEHLCAAILMRLLFAQIAVAKPVVGSPRILFATPPEELHTLGLLMAEAVLADNGAHCISVGPQTPLVEIDMAARAYRADVVGLSFSIAYPERRIRPFLTQLRSFLPDKVEIWVGGAGIAHMKRPPSGVRVFSDLVLPVQALSELTS